jgi:hypothetical protein
MQVLSSSASEKRVMFAQVSPEALLHQRPAPRLGCAGSRGLGSGAGFTGLGVISLGLIGLEAIGQGRITGTIGLGIGNISIIPASAPQVTRFCVGHLFCGPRRCKYNLYVCVEKTACVVSYREQRVRLVAS